MDAKYDSYSQIYPFYDLSSAAVFQYSLLLLLLLGSLIVDHTP